MKLNQEAFDVSLKKNDIIIKVQSLIKATRENFKKDLKKETKEFISVFLKALYFKNKQQDFFISPNNLFIKKNFQSVDFFL